MPIKHKVIGCDFCPLQGNDMHGDFCMHPEGKEVEIEEDIYDKEYNFIKTLNFEQEVPAHCPLLKGPIEILLEK